jgi:hypothetical protein
MSAKPTDRPKNPNFSSGPCSKRPGWSLSALEDAFTGRSHRAKGPKARLNEVITRSKAILGLPEGWRLGIVPGVGHWRGRDGDVVAARPPRRRRARVGVVQRRLGHRR